MLAAAPRAASFRIYPRTPVRPVVPSATSMGCLCFGSKTDRNREPQKAADRKTPAAAKPQTLLDRMRGANDNRDVSSSAMLADRGAHFPATTAILSLNMAIFILDHVLHLPLQWLYLNHANVQAFQLLTNAFCHGSWGHLSGNMFFILTFGR